MASLIERRGIYYIQFYNDTRRPSRKRLSLRTQRKRTAQRLLLKLEDDYYAGRFDPWTDDPLSYDEPDYEEVRLKEAGERFLERKRADGLKESSIRTYREILSLLEDEVGASTWLHGVRARELRPFVRQEGLAQATMYKRYGHLRTFFRWCVAESLLRQSPLEDVARPAKPAKLPKAVTVAEVERICEAIREDYQEKRKRGCIREGQVIWRIPLFRFALYTGMRASELARLRWGHLDFERGLITIRVQKNKKEQTIPLSDKAKEAIRDVERGGPRDYVFRSPHFTSQTRSARSFRGRVSRAFREGRKLAGIERAVSFHSLRHGFCTLLAEKGKSAFIIKEAARHASVETSQRYVSIANEHLKSEINDAFGD